MKKYFTLTLLLTTIITIPVLRSQSSLSEVDIYGYWVREKDGLQMQLSYEHENTQVGFSEIVVEGNNDFPCDLEKEIIYKNIIQEHDSVWTCDFLVVTVNDCSYNYKTGGKMTLTDMGKLLVICPGFQPMYYDKKNPRH